MTEPSSQGLPVVLLMGPTAAGKTALAVELAGRLPVDLVSVDSAMVYRFMDIGTGKPPPEVLARAPHRLIDIRDPAESYSAAAFRSDALRAIAEIRARGRAPLLVGGTGLYFRALRRGLASLPAADASQRARLAREAREHGLAALHAELARVDPAAARRIHRNDPQRIQRALEVYRLTGRPLSELQGLHMQPPLDAPVLALALEPLDRERLHRRIATRFHEMLAHGLLDEVSHLRARSDLHAALPSMRAVGYRQAWAHLAGECNHETMVERAISATRQLAKRQLTWLRSEAEVLRLDPAEAGAGRRVHEHLARALGG